MNIRNHVALILVCAGLAIPNFAGARPAPQTSVHDMQQTAQMRITGLSCAACAKGLEASIRKMPGVTRVSIDHKSGIATVTFDPAKQNLKSLAALVAECGYQVKESKVV